jgi:putative addiction module killer protein
MNLRLVSASNPEATLLDDVSSVNYSSQMIEVRQTAEFEAWLRSLADIRAAKRIAQRIVRIEAGRLGDVKFFEGIGELRIDHGPGYRVYFVQRGAALIILLCGGDKSSQKRDIRKAIAMAKEV